MITPDTDVFLLKVPLEINDDNQLAFTNKNAQEVYFSNLPKIELEQFTYQRKDKTMRVPMEYDDIVNYNYVMYRNTAYSNKWFYAFIERAEYINDGMTLLTLKTDVWQTWQFDLTLKPTFVEREHTNDDTIGSNTVPEPVQTGEFVINGSVVHLGPNPSGNYITFMVSDRYPLPLSMQTIASQYNGIYSGYTLFGVETADQASTVVAEYVADNRADAIKNIFLVPKTLYGTPTPHTGETFSFALYQPQNLTAPVSIIDNYALTRLNTLDEYLPKNNKLFTGQFSYVFMTNNVGGNAEYHYEDFVNATPRFRMSGIISSGCDIKINPLYYKNVSNPNEAYGLKLGKLPVCSWNTDSYAVWLAQNQLNMDVARQKLVVEAGVAAGFHSIEKLGSSVNSYINTVTNSLAQGYLAQHMPDQVHGDTNSSDYNYSAGLFIDIRRMSVRREYAKIIDDYFSMFGYATNRVKLPNINGRRNWNFVKTSRCYIEADIPQDDLQEIKLMFDKGITFWHNPLTFADYTQNNDII